jgi:rubrerythrin
MNDAPSAALLDALQAARAAEREQALYYRRLASHAEDAGDAALSERLNGLHADEQHHLSRLTARLLELGATAATLEAPPPAARFPEWEDEARDRERREIRRYEALLALGPDDFTTTILSEILQTERAHERELGGKWMNA